MTFVAAAVIGAVGVIGGAVIAGQAAKSAASDQAGAAENATQVQQGEFNTIQGEEAPGRNLGYGADSLLAQLYGLPDPNSTATTASYSANGASSQLTGQPSTLPGTGMGGVSGPGTSGATNPAFTGMPSVAGGVTNPMGFALNGVANYNGGSGPMAPSSTSGGVNYGANPQVNTAGGTGTGNSAGPAQYSVNGASSSGGAVTIDPTTGLPSNAPAGASSQFSNFYNSPGYQFTLGQGEQAVNRNASANGSLYSTNTLTAENNYAQGAASTQYNNYVQQLLSLSGIGGSAVAGTAQAATNAGNNISANDLSAGNAEASGALASGGAASSALNGVSNAFANFSPSSSTPSNPNAYYSPNLQQGEVVTAPNATIANAITAFAD
jgi:hypothetical protein